MLASCGAILNLLLGLGLPVAQEAPEGAGKEAREGVLKAVEDDQKKREVLLALQLRDRVQPFVDGKEAQWKQHMREEVEQLCQVRPGLAAM